MNNNYIKQLAAILTKTKFSQAQLAGRLKVTFAAFNRWMNGHAIPRPQKIKEIERLYQETVGYPSITSQNLKSIIQKANACRIKGIWGMVVSNQGLQDDIVLEQTYQSNAIEGSTLTKKETEAVIFDKSVISHKTLVEHLEATNHAAVLRGILEYRYKSSMTEELIKTFHRNLMQGIRPDAGRYSKHHRAIRGVNMALTHPNDIPEEMAHLMKDWNTFKRGVPVLSKIADFHTRFELIHPFGDGNGRVGRLVMILQCLQAGYPPVIIENIRKAEYYEVLEYAQRQSSAPFVVFMCDEIERTYTLMKKHLKRK